MRKPTIAIITPALADANNGNWQTARRWARMLAGAYKVNMLAQWQAGDEDLMIALHARRSAASVAAWRTAHPHRPLLLVLTGTDLYRDIASDASAQSSLLLADRLVVLNALGARALPEGLRHKASVILQSCPARMPLPKTRRHLRALMVGHLREEKSPQTYFEAARLLRHRADIRLDHVGAALEPALGEQARALMQTCPQYRWLGPLSHVQTLRRIQAAHVLVHCSRMEGGAHVLTEALVSGTPVLASCIDGNLGLLGEDWPGLFDWGDAAALAALLEQARDDGAMLAALREQGRQRAALFSPETEQARLRETVAQLLAGALREASGDTT